MINETPPNTIASLKGNATVCVGVETIGNALYHIQLAREAGLMVGVGTLQASALVVDQIASAGHAELKMEGGRSLKIRATDADALLGQVIFSIEGCFAGVPAELAAAAAPEAAAGKSS